MSAKRHMRLFPYFDAASTTAPPHDVYLRPVRKFSYPSRMGAPSSAINVLRTLSVP